MSIGALPAAANAAPTAPYNAVVLHVEQANPVVRENLALQAPGATLGVTLGADDRIRFLATAATQQFTVTVQPPVGQSWVVGNTIGTGTVRDTIFGFLDIESGTGDCDWSGYLWVRQLERDPATQAISSFAGTFTANCGGHLAAVNGELRFNSTIGYQAVAGLGTVDFGSLETMGAAAATRTVTLTSSGSEPVAVTGAPIIDGDDSFAIVGETCSGKTLAFGQACTVSVRAQAAAEGTLGALLFLPNDTERRGTRVVLSARGVRGAVGTYTPVAPARIMDTRSGLGAPKRPMGAGTTHTLQVTGRGGVPSTGVAAVVLNVTVTGGTGSSYLTVYPAGAARPTASSINFPAGWTGANSVTVALGTAGRVNIFHHAGMVHVIVDVVGYYHGTGKTTGLGGQFQPTYPFRMFDSRVDFNNMKLTPGMSVVFPFGYVGDAHPHVRAVAINVTAVGAAANGFLTAWNGNLSARPLVSTLNYAPGQVVANMAVVPVRKCDGTGGTNGFPMDCTGIQGLPIFGIYTSQSVHVIIDVVGFFDDGGLADGMRFRPMSPTRIVDSRYGTGIPGPIGHSATTAVYGPSHVIPDDTWAVAMNFTAVQPTAPATWLAVWDTDQPNLPTVSNINVAKGQIRSNAVVTMLGVDLGYQIYNAAGNTNVINDILGTYYIYPGTASASALSAMKAGVRPDIRPRRAAPGTVRARTVG